MKAKNVFKRMGALALAAAMIAGTWTVSAQPANFVLYGADFWA